MDRSNDPATIAKGLSDDGRDALERVAKCGGRFEYYYPSVKELEKLGLITVSMNQNHQHLWCDASLTPLGVAVREALTRKWVMGQYSRDEYESDLLVLLCIALFGLIAAIVFGVLESMGY